MKLLAQALTRAALVAALLIPAAALAEGPGSGGYGGHGGFGRSSGAYGASAAPGQRLRQRLQANTARRVFQVKLDNLAIRRTMRRLSGEAQLRRSGSPGDVARYVLRARLQNELDDRYLREGLRREFITKRGPWLRVGPRSWSAAGAARRRMLMEALDRRRLRVDLELKARTRSLERELAWPERGGPQLRTGDATPNAMRRLLTFMGH